MIVLVADSPSFGASYTLRTIFGEDTRLLCVQPDGYREYDPGLIFTPQNKAECLALVQDADCVWALGGPGLDVLLEIGSSLPIHWLRDLTWVFWAMDTRYQTYPARYNTLLWSENVMRMFAMPDLMGLAPSGTIPLYPPMPLNVGEKPEMVHIVHSPGTEKKRVQKGTDAIEAAIADLSASYSFDYHTIMRTHHADVLKEKATAHIVIDKLGAYQHGLGLSGLEGMASRAVVFSSMHDVAFTDGYFARPPVVTVNTGADLRDGLAQILGDEVEVRYGLDVAMHTSLAWAREHIIPSAWLDYVERYL